MDDKKLITNEPPPVYEERECNCKCDCDGATICDINCLNCCLTPFKYLERMCCNDNYDNYKDTIPDI